MFRLHKCRHSIERVKNLIRKTEAKMKHSRKTKNLRKRTLTKLILKKLKDKLKQRMKKSKQGEVLVEQSESFNDSLSEILERNSSEIQEHDSKPELESCHQSVFEASKEPTTFKFSMSRNFKLRINSVTYDCIIQCICIILLCAFIIHSVFDTLMSGNCIFTQILTF